MKCLPVTILTLTLMNLFGCDGSVPTVKPDGRAVMPIEKPVKSDTPSNSKSSVKTGEQFTLKADESLTVEGANLEITVNRIGRKWEANGGEESLDFTFTVKHDGKSETYSHPLTDAVTADDYKIKVVKTESFGYGYATFIVTKNDS